MHVQCAVCCHVGTPHNKHRRRFQQYFVFYLVAQAVPVSIIRVIQGYKTENSAAFEDLGFGIRRCILESIHSHSDQIVPEY
jgi:hypothetical protein